MTNLRKAHLELTEAQLLNIGNRIRTWNTKKQVINIMRYRYGRLDNKAAKKLNNQLSFGILWGTLSSKLLPN